MSPTCTSYPEGAPRAQVDLTEALRLCEHPRADVQRTRFGCQRLNLAIRASHCGHIQCSFFVSFRGGSVRASLFFFQVKSFL